MLPLAYGIDLSLHAGVYAIVAILTVLLDERPPMSATVISALAVLIEILQAFMLGRTGSWADLAANGFGIAMALSVMSLLGAREFLIVAVRTVSMEATVRASE